MSISQQTSASNDSIVEIKSKYDAEFRRFSISRAAPNHFVELCELLKKLHHLPADVVLIVQYTDKEDDLLAISNDDNLSRAVRVARGLLRLFVQRKDDKHAAENNGCGHVKNGSNKKLVDARHIVFLDDFRRVSSIIDVDIVPDAHRRVRLVKSDSKPLGFFIRDGSSIRVTPFGIEEISGIFISRLLLGGLAESTGLLAVNDEVIEVNGIEVSGKTLDQVTDMMVVNSTNLIITVKPVNQSTCLPRRVDSNRQSCMSASSINIDCSNRSNSLEWQGEMVSKSTCSEFVQESLHHNRHHSSRLSEEAVTL